MLYFVEEIDLKSSINPVTGKEYLPESSIVVLDETDSPDMFCGQGENGVYTVRISTGNKNWEMTIGDFIDYTQAEQREAVVCLSGKWLAVVRAAYQGHCCADRKLRAYEPRFLVHSTTYECGRKILEDKSLKSWNCLRSERGISGEIPIGRRLGDPEYFCDYIMFSQGAVSSEIVVMSKQAGEIIMDVNRRYKTGIRFYLDAEAMAGDGLLIRDGIHLKVKEKLSLEKYLLWWADWERAGLPGPVSTPLEFTQRANARFHEKNQGF